MPLSPLTLVRVMLEIAEEPALTDRLFGTAVIVWQITGDGEAVAFEGWALVAIYAVLAALTLYE